MEQWISRKTTLVAETQLMVFLIFGEELDKF